MNLGLCKCELQYWDGQNMVYNVIVYGENNGIKMKDNVLVKQEE